MDNSQRKYQPADLIRFLDSDSEFAKVIKCPTTVYNIELIGREAAGLFGQVKEELYRKDPGWKDRFEVAAVKFAKIAGFRPEAVYQAQAELHQSKGLSQLVDRQRKPLLEGLNSSPFSKAKEM